MLPDTGPWRGLSEACTDANLMCGESRSAVATKQATPGAQC